MDNPYAALAWFSEEGKPELIAPPSWAYLVVKKNVDDSLECKGKLAAISGERQTPQRALITPLEDAPAMLYAGKFYYINGNPFSAFQAWLQGQENLEPWLAWRHRIFWLDELAASICKTLRYYQLLPDVKKWCSRFGKNYGGF